MAKSYSDSEKIDEKEIEYKKEQCFVIMPIGDHPSHEKGHFTKIYRDIIKPAIQDAGFEPYRADEGGGSQNIQIDIIKKIIEAPMAICDLSTRNPNVLFELGIRQAFDLPVALIQEVGTERIFDINTFNTGEYRSARIYDEVVQDRKAISDLVKTTFNKHNEGDGINSIIRLIPAISSAKLSTEDVNSNELLKIMFNQINTLTDEISNLKRDINVNEGFSTEVTFDIDGQISYLLDSLPVRDEKIFRLLTGIGVARKHTLKEISIEMGMSLASVKSSIIRTKAYLSESGVEDVIVELL